MKSLNLAGALALALSANASAGADVVPAAKSAADIAACMRANSVRQGSVRDITLDSVDREGKAKLVKVHAYWKPDAATGVGRLHMRVASPEILAGSAYLVLEQPAGDEIYLYLPMFQAVMELKSGDMTTPMWGTGISYAELKEVQGLLLGSSAARKPDAAISGRPAYVIDTVTDVGATGYRRVVSYVDQATCVLLKAEFFADGSAPLKTLEADVATLSTSGPPYTVSSLMLRTPRDNSHTQIIMGASRASESLPEKLFDKEDFYTAPLP